MKKNRKKEPVYIPNQLEHFLIGNPVRDKQMYLNKIRQYQLSKKKK